MVVPLIGVMVPFCSVGEVGNGQAQEEGDHDAHGDKDLGNGADGAFQFGGGELVYYIRMS